MEYKENENGDPIEIITEMTAEDLVYYEKKYGRDKNGEIIAPYTHNLPGSEYLKSIE